MNLYKHKESNIRRTWFLFTIFLVVVIGIGWVFSQIYGSPVILVFFVLFSVLMSFISYWYSDKIVLRISRAKEIHKKDNPELYNILENLSITAGLPMPKLYLIDEAAANAFATGRNPEHAVVAVTRGLLEGWTGLKLRACWRMNCPMLAIAICFFQPWLWCWWVLWRFCRIFFCVLFFGEALAETETAVRVADIL